MVDEVETQLKFIGEVQIPSFDNYNHLITISVTNETPMYRFCDQSFFYLSIFPAIPSLLGGDWMSSEQKQFSEIYGWFGLAIIIVILVLLPFSIRKSTNTMHKVCSLLTIFNLYLVLCTCTNK